MAGSLHIQHPWLWGHFEPWTFGEQILEEGGLTK